MKKNLVGIIWFILSLIISSLNDTISRYLSIEISALQTSFFRFFFGVLSLIPFIFFKGLKSIKTSRPLIHFIRGAFLAVAIFLWIKGLGSAQVVIATIISFTIPIFTLVIAPIFLKEQVSIKLWIFTIFGLIGIIITLNPYHISFNTDMLFLVIAAILFATLDIINKKYIIKESILSMLLYSSVITTFLLLIPILIHIKNWKIPEIVDLMYLICLGIGSNLILFCLLKSFCLVKVSSIASFRYLELLISIILSYFIFNEVPTRHIYIGAFIIICSSLYIILQNQKSNRGANNKSI